MEADIKAALSIWLSGYYTRRVWECDINEAEQNGRDDCEALIRFLEDHGYKIVKEPSK